MARLMPFRAVHYDTDKVGADLGAVIAPPYDIIDSEEGRLLANRHPWNVVPVGTYHTAAWRTGSESLCKCSEVVEDLA